MICAVFMGIQVRQLQEVAMPFLIAVVLGTIATLFICLWFGRRSPEHGFERGLTLFGYCTGTAASGCFCSASSAPNSILRLPLKWAS